MFDHDKGKFENQRQGYLFSYAQITFNQFKRLAVINADKSEPEDYRKFTISYEREAEKRECKILCVLTTALFVESYIFDYCARKKSESYFKKYLDRLDPVAKWILTTKIIATPGLNENAEIIGRLNHLFKFRNSLVHHKTKKSDTFNDLPEFPEDLIPYNCLKLIHDLLENLLKLDPSEEFAKYVLSHFGSWSLHAGKNPKLYPIPWEA